MVPDVNLEPLRAAIVAQFPELAQSRFTLLTAGWDSVAVDVDDRLIFKFPRHAAGEQGLLREASLLAAIRPAVTMRVPDLSIHSGPPMFSRHSKIIGEHLVTSQYDLLPDEARRRLAAEMALFYAELHRLDTHLMAEAGATVIGPWVQPEEILRRTFPLLTSALRRYADSTIGAWQQLSPDPYETIYGFFDGHGWNMAFDHARHRLNGVYDFADSGFGSLHQEFIYSNWIARDLTSRIIDEYETLTGRVLDRERVELLSGVLRLSELAEAADDADRAEMVVRLVKDWAVPRS